MKHLANFKQSGPLYLNQGDFPLEQLNSKDLYIEVSETFLKIKDNFLQEETNQSNEYNKNSAFLKNNRDASYQEDNKRYKKNTELSFQKNEAISFQEDEKALFLENGPSFYFGKNNQRLNEEHPNIPENQNFPHSKSNKIGCFPEKLDKSLEVKFSEFETPLNKLQILKQKRQKSLDYRILNQTYNLDKSFDNPTKDQSFDLFLQKEKNFQLKSEENVLKLKEMLEYNQSLEFYNTPKINKHNNKILQNNAYIKQPVFSRLSSHNRKTSKDSFFRNSYKDFNNLNDLNKSFSNINKSLTSNEIIRKVENNHKNDSSLRNVSLDLKEIRSNYLKGKSQEKTEINYFNKIHKEVLHTLENMSITPIPEQITYLQTLEIMYKMGFLKYHQIQVQSRFLKSNNYFYQERTLIAKMWNFLKSNQKKVLEGNEDTIFLENLVHFLAGILGVQSILMPQNTDNDSCLTFNRNDWTIPKIISFDYQSIHQEYELFYCNRLSFLKKPNQKPITTQKKNNISKRSESLAAKYYQKILEPDEVIDKISFHEKLVRKQALTQAKIREKSIEHDQKVLENCTFKPSISKKLHYKTFSLQKPDTNSLIKIKTMLKNEDNDFDKHNTQINKINLNKPKVMKKTEEIDYERQKNECTFKPNLIKAYLKQPQFHQDSLTNQQRKNIERMEQARIERGFQKNFKERGINSRIDVLKDIGNLSVSNVDPELMKKYFGKTEKEIEKTTSFQKNINLNGSFNNPSNSNQSLMGSGYIHKNSSIEKYSSNTLKNDEGYYTRLIQREFESLKEKKSVSNFDSEKKSDLKPILFLEINLGNENFEKISVYIDSNPIVLAETFAKKHSLGTGLLEKLKQRFSIEIEKKKQSL